MSKLETITIDTPSGSNTMQIGSTNTATINLGVSGDTINVPAGVTIANAGTATGFGVAGTNAFKAEMSSNQGSVSDDTWTKVAFNTDTFDADSVFDTSNNRFIAPAAGKYFVMAKIYMFPNTANGNKGQSAFYKNGSVDSRSTAIVGLGGSDNYLAEGVFINSMIFNLSQDDYIEVYGRFNTPSGTVSFNKDHSFFAGYTII